MSLLPQVTHFLGAVLTQWQCLSLSGSQVISFFFLSPPKLGVNQSTWAGWTPISSSFYRGNSRWADVTKSENRNPKNIPVNRVHLALVWKDYFIILLAVLVSEVWGGVIFVEEFVTSSFGGGLWFRRFHHLVLLRTKALIFSFPFLLFSVWFRSRLKKFLRLRFTYRTSKWERKRFTSTSWWLATWTRASPPPPAIWSTSAVVSTSEPLRSSRRKPRR